MTVGPLGTREAPARPGAKTRPSPRSLRTALVAVASLALAVRLAAFLGASAVDPASVMRPDSYLYDQLARTLLDHGRFAEGADGPVHRRRAPGFPLLIAAVYAVAGDDARAVVLVGIALSVLTVCLTSWIAYRLWGGWPAVIAGLLLALDVPSVTASRFLLTETPFTFLLVAGTAIGVALVSGARPTARQGLLMGAILASAALTRPIGLFLSLPVAAWLVASGRSLGWGRRATFRMIASFATAWIVIVGGWQLRNQRALGAAAASDEPVKILFHVRGADIIAQRDRIPVEQARAQLRSLARAEPGDTRSRENRQLRAALGLIAQHPILFLRTQVRWLPELLLGTGAAGLSAALGPGDASDLPHRVARVAANVVPALHLLVLYAGAAWCLWQVRNESVSRRVAILLMAGLVAYFVVLSAGPMAYSRFRVPFTPLLAVCAARGLQLARDRSRSGANTSSSAAA
jgi:4-amino-4-deoxy-L-arabinose transferase-like glycosyltransferase